MTDLAPEEAVRRANCALAEMGYRECIRWEDEPRIPCGRPLWVDSSKIEFVLPTAIFWMAISLSGFKAPCWSCTFAVSGDGDAALACANGNCAHPDGPHLPTQGTTGVGMKRDEWTVASLPYHSDAVAMIERWHYSKSSPNTSTYRHGLFRSNDLPFLGEPYGCALWIPPTKNAAVTVAGDDWRGVLSLSRFVVSPDAPKNAASYLLGASMRMIDRARWPHLLTYADTAHGHHLQGDQLARARPSTRWRLLDRCRWKTARQEARQTNTHRRRDGGSRNDKASKPPQDQVRASMKPRAFRDIKPGHRVQLDDQRVYSATRVGPHDAQGNLLGITVADGACVFADTANTPPGGTPSWAADGTQGEPMTNPKEGAMTNPDAKYGAVELGLTWCWHWGLIVERDLALDGKPIDHYNPENRCPGPHGIMWAASGASVDVAC